MSITVSDIERKEFAYKGAGYDPYDVDQYLDQICDEMVAMQDRIVQLEKELDEANREAEKAIHAAKPLQAEPFAAPAAPQVPVTRTSETLEAILLNAQKLADDAVEDANRKAEDMLGKAKQDAAEITENAREEKVRIEEEYASLREAAQTFKESFLKILEEHKSLFDKQLKTTEEI